MFASISKQRSNFSTSHFHILSEKYLRTSCLVQNKVVNLQSVKATTLTSGEMVEWSITAVLKTAVPRGTGGSNPSLSAINLENQGFANKVHEIVHENALKHQFLGVLLSQNKKPSTHHRVWASSLLLH